MIVAFVIAFKFHCDPVHELIYNRVHLADNGCDQKVDAVTPPQ